MLIRRLGGASWGSPAGILVLGLSAATLGAPACKSSAIHKGGKGSGGDGGGAGEGAGGTESSSGGGGARGLGGSNAGGTSGTTSMGGSSSSGTGGGSSGGSAGASDGSGGTGGSSSGGSAGASDGGSGGTGGQQAVCDPLSTPSADACVITEAYGVFVHPGGSDETGDGSRSGPFASLTHALTVAVRDGKRVYACATTGDFVESLVLDDSHDGVEIYGGFNCDNWEYDTALHAVIASPATSGLRITDTSDAHVENFSITVTSPTGNGTSSIAALLANTTDITLRRVTVAAGDGRPGLNGVNGSPGDAGSLAGPAPAGRNANCADNFQQREGPGWASESSCGSRGGNGGYTFAYSWAQFGGNGFPGVPNTNVNPPGTDNGGVGADEGTSATAGQPGSPGTPGTPGTAGPAIGVFSMQGYAAPTGGAGGDGHTGQGGGGGGSGIAFTCSGHGPSGGVGGMGGCGGTLGTGAQGGGASLALLSWNNQSLVLDDCELAAGTGGAGGRGGIGGISGIGAAGGAAGSIGNPAVATLAGAGGRGGNGGNGGSGAGGAGGPSIALAHSGELPIQRNGTTLTAGVGGDAGPGGDAVADEGAQGMSADVYQQP